MKSSKLVSLLSVVVIVAIALTACAAPAAPAPAAPAPTTVPAATTAPAAPAATTAPAASGGQPVELIYMRQAEGSQVELDLVDKFNQTHPNIKVKPDSVPGGDTYSKLVLTTQGNAPPDVYMTYFTLGAATNGMALDLTSFINAEGKDWFNGLSENGWTFHEWAGKFYGVPWRVSPSVVIFNPTLLEKAGLQVPSGDWTWDDFAKYAKAMTHPDKDEYGFCLIGSADDPGTDYQFYPFLFEAGGVMINKDGLPGFNSDAGVQALQFLTDLINKEKVVPPGTTSATANTCTDLLAAGKVGMYMNASLWMGIVESTHPGLKLVAAPMPKGKTTGALIGGTGFAIHPNSKHQKEAWEFIKFMVSPENMRPWSQALKFTPPNVSLLQDPTFAGSTAESKAVSQAMLNQKMYPLTHYPEGPDLEAKLRTYIQAAYLNKMTPKAALDGAAQEWQPILQKYTKDNWWAAWNR